MTRKSRPNTKAGPNEAGKDEARTDTAHHDVEVTRRWGRVRSSAAALRMIAEVLLAIAIGCAVPTIN